MQTFALEQRSLTERAGRLLVYFRFIIKTNGTISAPRMMRRMGHGVPTVLTRMEI